MNKFVKCALLCFASAILVLAVGCGPSADARKIEDIRGTYSLKEYYVSEGGQKTSFAETFEYFYLVVADGATLRVAYKPKDEMGYSATEYSYVCKYQAGSDEFVEELKFRFNMPYPLMEGGLVVNYLTVTGEDLLACQKIIYQAASEKDRPSVWKQIFISLVKISDDTDFGYVERSLGHEVVISQPEPEDE